VIGQREELDFQLEIVDEKGNIARVLGRLASLVTAIAAYDEAVKQYPRERIHLRHRARIVRNSERPG